MALAAAAALTFVAFPAIGNGHPWALYLEWVGSKTGAAAFALFFLTTPVRRWMPLRRVLLWAPVPILAFYSYVAVLQPGLYALVKAVGYSYVATCAIAGVAAMALPFVTRSTEVQRRLWPVVLGTALAAVTYLALSLVPYIIFRRYLLPAEVAILGVSFIPVGFAWAMLRYPFLGVALGPWALVRTVFETTTDRIFVVGRNGHLVDASYAGLAMLGIAKPKEAKEPLEQLLGGLQASSTGRAASYANLIQRVLGGEVVRDEELELHVSNGQTAFMSVAGTPLYDERGRVDMAVLSLRDITERKRREEERHKLQRQKDEFLASISHDLQAPLTAIQFSVGAVLANEPTGTPEPLHRLLANIQVSADKAATLVDDLLELARLQAGRVKLRLDRCDLREVTLHTAATIEHLASTRCQVLHLDVPPGPCPATVDEGRLERVLANLLSNAHKHGRRGGAIKLSLRQRSGEAVFAVSDDGIGIPAAEQERIFESFYRVETDTEGRTAGTGLGLSIARAMVELHGGRIWVESGPGGGTTFWFTLPTGLRSLEDTDVAPQ